MACGSRIVTIHLYSMLNGKLKLNCVCNRKAQPAHTCKWKDTSTSTWHNYLNPGNTNSIKANAVGLQIDIGWRKGDTTLHEDITIAAADVFIKNRSFIGADGEGISKVTRIEPLTNNRKQQRRNKPNSTAEIEIDLPKSPFPPLDQDEENSTAQNRYLYYAGSSLLFRKAQSRFLQSWESSFTPSSSIKRRVQWRI